jgi:hypothetical protein
MRGVALLTLLACICGLVAAGCWFRVARSLEASGEAAAIRKKRAMGDAALATALAVGLASVAGLLGIYASGI